MNYWNYDIILGAFYVIVVGGQPLPCTTPNGEKATCVTLNECQILLDAFNKDVVAKKFVEASACFEGAFMVCCGTTGNFTQDLNKFQKIGKPLNESSQDYVIRNKLLPGREYCGMQHTDDYFYNGTATSVDEFPWLVYIGIPQDYVYNYYSQKDSNCVGVLISNRFILTSYRNCLLRAIDYGADEEFKTRSIILGQHHIYKDVSCMPTRYDIDDCTGPIIRVEPYPWNFPPPKHDVAIIGLVNKVQFSDFIRPICLPLHTSDIPKPGDIVYTSGWGEELFVEGKNVTLKKRVRYTAMDNEECKIGNTLEDPICGLPLKNNTQNVCPGDNGGPLMYRHDNNWFVIGLVSHTIFCDEVQPVAAIQLTPEIIDFIYDSMFTIDTSGNNA